MKLTPRNQLIVVAALCGVVVVALAAVLVVPSFQRIGQLDLEIENAVQDSDSARLLLEQRQQVKNRAAATSQNLVQLSVAIPETPEMPSLIIDLHDSADEAGVELRSLQPARPVAAAGIPYVAVPFQMEIWGSWADTIEYLRRVNRLTRQVRIVSFDSQLLPTPDEQSTGTTRLSFPPYYQVRTIVNANAYVITPESLQSTTTPAPVAPPTE